MRVRFSLRPPEIMNLDNLNNLIELFSLQADKQNKKDIFLEWLNPLNKKTYTWEETQNNILKLSKIIRENIKEDDRCLLVSENRPEWFISDLAIMLSDGITVPAYTTYTDENCKAHIKNYRFDLASEEIYELVWSNFCDWYIEFNKVSICINGNCCFYFILYRLF